MAEARLEDVGTGLAPTTDGWFVVNARDAAWVRNATFGARCVFEASERVLAGRPDLAPQRFPEIGITLAVVEPGKPSGLYHAESAQEDLLVLRGACDLIVEEEVRRLGPWDFVHFPGGTHHILVGAGDEPAVVLWIGARPAGRTIDYPVSAAAQARGAGVDVASASPAEAYAAWPRWEVGRPEGWASLPWA